MRRNGHPVRTTGGTYRSLPSSVSNPSSNSAIAPSSLRRNTSRPISGSSSGLNSRTAAADSGKGLGSSGSGSGSVSGQGSSLGSASTSAPSLTPETDSVTPYSTTKPSSNQVSDLRTNGHQHNLTAAGIGNAVEVIIPIAEEENPSVATTSTTRHDRGDPLQRV